MVRSSITEVLGWVLPVFFASHPPNAVLGALQTDASVLEEVAHQMGAAFGRRTRRRSRAGRELGARRAATGAPSGGCSDSRTISPSIAPGPSIDSSRGPPKLPPYLDIAHRNARAKRNPVERMEPGP